MRWIRAGWLATLGLLAGCGDAGPPPGGLEVVATFYPLYEFSREVAGSRARVTSLLPPGVEPHDWEPSPQDLARVGKASLVVYNGGGLEPWMDRVLGGGAGPAAVKATEGLPLLAAERPGTGGGVPADPHAWLDPVLARVMVDNIRAALARIDPAGAAVYRDNAERFGGRLETLHRAIDAGLADCARREIVVSHAAFSYFARRYRLTVVPVMGVAPEAEPSPAQLAAIVRFARERKVKYIFFETLVSSRLAETLAREVGAATLVFNPVEGLTPAQAAAGKGYVELMEENLKNLRIALGCR